MIGCRLRHNTKRNRIVTFGLEIFAKMNLRLNNTIDIKNVRRLRSVIIIAFIVLCILMIYVTNSLTFNSNEPKLVKDSENTANNLQTQNESSNDSKSAFHELLERQRTHFHLNTQSIVLEGK